MVKEKVLRTIKEQNLIKKGAQMIVGISGGPDSVCLLHILSRLAEDLSLQLFALHVNHGLRGAAADADEKWTVSFCESLGIPCRVIRADVEALAREQGLTVEEAGRKLRYEAFFAFRRELGDAYIAVAHNADDQAETVLMRILRGTGMDGLAGMEVLRQDGVLRPLLHVSRKEIEGYCREQGLEFCRDLSNESTDYTRNRIRLELLPYIREHFNPNINGALLRLAGIAAEERALMDRLGEEFLEKEKGLPLEPLRSLDAALRKRVILLALKREGLSRDVTGAHLEAADRLIREGSVSGQVEFPKGYVLKMGYDRAEIVRREQPLSLAGTAPFDRGGSIVVKGVSREEYAGFLSTSSGARGATFASRGKLPQGGDFRVFISGDHVEEGTLEIRTRQPGDFIRPFGMTGRKSLQDYLVDRKVPRELRDWLPLVCEGQEVLWVPGVGVSERCRISEETEKILSLEYFE